MLCGGFGTAVEPMRCGRAARDGSILRLDTSSPLELMLKQRVSISLCVSMFGLALVLPLNAAGDESIPSETALWFDKPASNFTESLPLGNGRLGAMMFGGVNEERIVLN